MMTTFSEPRRITPANETDGKREIIGLVRGASMPGRPWLSWLSRAVHGRISRIVSADGLAGGLAKTMNQRPRTARLSIRHRGPPPGDHCSPPSRRFRTALRRRGCAGAGVRGTLGGCVDLNRLAAFEAPGRARNFGTPSTLTVSGLWMSLSVVMMSPTRRPIRSPVVICVSASVDDQLDQRASQTAG